MIERLLLNLSLLVAMCVFSRFVMDHWASGKKGKFWLQGFMFGLVAVAGMLIPVKSDAGFIFDGRTVVLSLVAWFFGWRAVVVSGGMAVGMRVFLGGPGAFPGSMVILMAASIGLLFRRWVDPVKHRTTTAQSLALGLATHAAMFGLLLFLYPPHAKNDFIEDMLVPLFVLYPLATLLVARILMDQHQREESEHQLRVALEEKALVLQTAMTGYQMLDVEGRILEVNDAICEMSGYSREELLGKYVTDFSPDEDPESLRKIVELISSQGGARLERRGYHKDGHVMLFDISTRAIEIEGEVRVCSFCQDITEIREQEKMMRLHSASLEAAANRVLITDAEGKIEWANRAFSAGSGFSLDEVIGKEPGELLKSGIQDPEFYRGMWDTILKGDTWTGEVTNRHKDGHVYQEDMTITPLVDSAGEITHFIAIKQDITEKKQMEQMFHRAQRMEGIGSLSSGIAHDLNNILSPIMMSADILKSSLPEGPDREIAELILRSTSRGAGIVQQLLNYARGAEGDKVEVNLVHLLKEVHKMYRETFPPNVSLEDHVSQDLWTIWADPGQIHQVLSNLLVNARDALPESGGKIRLEAENLEVKADWAKVNPPAVPGKFIRVTVEDNGTGMNEETLQKIFDPFFTTKAEGKGTGIGLPTTLGLVKGHDGFILVTSTPGAGSRFEVHLPIYQRKGDENADQRLEFKKPAPGHGERVLVVDDEESVRIMLKESLHQLGYDVKMAENGEAALTCLDGEPKPELILLDFMMPGMGGEGVLKELDRRGLHIPTLIISGMLPESKITNGKVMGRSIFYKPFSVTQLAQRIRDVLQEDERDSSRQSPAKK
ncbi:MAG: PAS domain S-box protein [Kiritimatiellia bacterium]